MNKIFSTIQNTALCSALVTSSLVFGSSLAAQAREVVFHNKCYFPVDLAILYQLPDGTWITDGWWSFDANAENVLGNNFGSIETDNGILYYYARIDHPNHQNYVWEGTTQVDLRGQPLAMREVRADVDGNFYHFGINCQNLANAPELMPTFPIRGNRHQSINTGFSGHHMETSFELNQNGVVSGTTRTWSNNEVAGFHGEVAVTFLDVDGRAVAVIKKGYGVDCAGFWCGNDDRTETWSAQIDTNAMPRIRSYLIEHRHNPNWGGLLSQFQAWLDSPEGQEAMAIGRVIVDLYSGGGSGAAAGGAATP